MILDGLMNRPYRIIGGVYDVQKISHWMGRHPTGDNMKFIITRLAIVFQTCPNHR